MGAVSFHLVNPLFHRNYHEPVATPLKLAVAIGGWRIVGGQVIYSIVDQMTRHNSKSRSLNIEKLTGPLPKLIDQTLLYEQISKFPFTYFFSRNQPILWIRWLCDESISITCLLFRICTDLFVCNILAKTQLLLVE